MIDGRILKNSGRMMKVLLIGSGGREHALVWKIAQSKHLEKLYVAPGNGGTELIAENVALDIADHKAVVDFCLANGIELVVVGPEVPLVAGIVDDLQAAGILAFGPNKAAAQLEGSKAFTHALCDEMNIPAAGYARFTEAAPARAYLAKQGAPIVIKADGLAAGKGVTVAMTAAEAETALNDCFSGTFGSAGAEVVIEEFLEGEEVSIFAVCDGENFVTLASAQDHKRAFDGDKGPNTGGMGAYSPAPLVNDELLARIEREIIAPTFEGMAARGTPFRGVLFAGLMVRDGVPKLIEHNVRFGDPECQVLMMRLESDLLELLVASAKGDLSQIDLSWSNKTALSVVMAANGYPGPYDKSTEISGSDQQNDENVHVFHAGTKRMNGKLLANGGRVLNVTARGNSVSEAQQRAYSAIEKIEWADGFYRRDIGWRAVAREKDGT